MLVELTFLLLIAVVGRLALSRLPGHGVDPSGAIVGSALYVAAVIVLLGVGLPAQPLTAMLVSLAAGLLLAFGADPRMWRSRVSGLRPERRTAIATTLVLSTGALLHPLRLVRDATDASAHLAYAARLQDGPFAIAEVGIKRGVSFAAIEAVGVLGGDVAVMGVVPALGVAGLLSAYAIVRAEDPTGDAGRILGLVALAIVATNARFLTNLMLIGPHLVVALWLMVLVAVLAGVGDSGGVRADRPRLAIVAALAMALAAARPEGILLVVPAVAPFLVRFAEAPARPREVQAVAVGLLLWLVPYHTDRFSSLPDGQGTATIVLGIGLLIATVPAVRHALDRLRVVGLAHVVPWVGLAAFFVLDPGGTIRRLVSTAANVALDVGGWGVGLLLIVVIAVAVRIVSRSALPLRSGLLLGTFLPIHLMLGLLTGEGYHIGEGSSLNRMIFHIYPVLVVAVSAAVVQMMVEEDEQQSAPSQPADGG